MHCRLILAAGVCRMADDEGGQFQRGATQHCGYPECVSLDRRVVAVLPGPRAERLCVVVTAAF
jgi:hypothetical protein